MTQAAKTFPVVCVYAASDGASHLTQLALPALDRVETADGAARWIGLEQAREWGVIVSDGATYGDWHASTQVGLSIVLQGAWEIEAGTGQRHLLTAGNVLLMLDTTGQGHRSRLASAAPCVVMGLALDALSEARFRGLLREALASIDAPTAA